MSEIERIAEQMRRSFAGGAWHGPALGEAVGAVGAEEAVARPLPTAHTIWEVVHHVGAWHDVARRRLVGERVDSLPDERDWPAAGSPSPARWRAVRHDLEQRHRRLLETVRSLNDDRLDTDGGNGFSVYELLHGVIQHDLYHAGQIVLLHKAVRSTPGS